MSSRTTTQASGFCFKKCCSATCVGVEVQGVPCTGLLCIKHQIIGYNRPYSEPVVPCLPAVAIAV